MQRSNEAALRSKLYEEQQKAAEESQWVLDFGEDDIPTSSIQIEEDQSYMSFSEEPLIGRQSYQSYNKEIEKLAKEQESQARIQKASEVDMRESVSDKEMASRFTSINKQKPSSGNQKGQKGQVKRKRDEEGNNEVLVKKEKVASASTTTPSKTTAASTSAASASTAAVIENYSKPNRFKFLKPEV
ncbi:hypothetical protein HDU76_007443 [Blyttiomyces sp. JEL0837]|nr:hypothetical protein HDU76_007443 [Blyttiomyces sp. JEL0837]